MRGPGGRTLYFNDRGRARGVVADHVRDFERHIDKTYAKELGKRPITVCMTPTTRDAMLQLLVEGRGDIVAANLSVTDARQARVDFVAPADQRPVSEVVVTGPNSPANGTASTRRCSRRRATRSPGSIRTRAAT